MNSSRFLPILIVYYPAMAYTVDAAKAGRFPPLTVWTGNLIGGGFSFDNPNADRSCGCGTSFMPRKTASG